MTDPYELLGESLVQAARRMQPRRASTRLRLSHRLNAALLAAVLALGGGAAALAASGLLSGSPAAAPGGKPMANVGIGAPSPGADHGLALEAPDPEGGLPWGMRVVRTTRAETCVQIGRVENGQLGQLGIDGAYHDDGRFHPLSAEEIPSVGGGYATITCLLPGETTLGYSPTEHRNAEWGIGVTARPSPRHLRSVSWGLLGPHAVSVAYTSSRGLKTVPVTRGEGAFMIVRPVVEVPPQMSIGGFQSGTIVGHDVGLEPTVMGLAEITYRFGSFVCSVGRVPASAKRCSSPPRELLARPRTPTRRLNIPVHARTVTQTPARCRAEYLLDPCYAAEVEFRAPYAISDAGSEYSVIARSRCTNARPSDWGIERNIRQGETVRSRSLGYFDCTVDEFEVQYINSARARGLPGAHRESAILGVARLGKRAPRER